MLKLAGAVLMGLALVVGGATTSDAASSRKAKRAPQSKPVAQTRDPKAQPGYNGYYERMEDRVPFGTKLWWDVYSSMPRSG